jgi:predicted Zn-dependent protease
MSGVQELEADPRAAPAQELVERLARHWPENPYSFRVGVIDDEQPNAFAVPGGWIGVTTGLLAQLESENELALVLGHEIGHFRNRDHLRGLGRGIALAVVLGALGLADSGATSSLATFAAGVADRAFDRDQESDADLFGLALVYSEYGHVAGALGFFERLPEPESAVERHLTHYLATHPMNEDRIDALVSAAQSAGWPFAGDLVPLEIDLDVDAGTDAAMEGLEANAAPRTDP